MKFGAKYIIFVENFTYFYTVYNRIMNLEWKSIKFGGKYVLIVEQFMFFSLFSNVVGDF